LLLPHRLQASRGVLLAEEHGIPCMLLLLLVVQDLVGPAQDRLQHAGHGLQTSSLVLQLHLDGGNLPLHCQLRQAHGSHHACQRAARRLQLSSPGAVPLRGICTALQLHDRHTPWQQAEQLLPQLLVVSCLLGSEYQAVALAAVPCCLHLHCSQCLHVGLCRHRALPRLLPGLLLLLPIALLVLL
jgi:hypothetical protein